MNEESLKKMALVIAASCLSVDDNSEYSLKSDLADSQQQFNKQVSDRIYTFLLYLLNKPSNEYSSLMTELAKKLPADWVMPDLDQSFIQIANKSSNLQHGSVL